MMRIAFNGKNVAGSIGSPYVSMPGGLHPPARPVMSESPRLYPREHMIGTYERARDHLAAQIDAALADPSVGAKAFMLMIGEYAQLLMNLKLLRDSGTTEGGKPV